MLKCHEMFLSSFFTDNTLSLALIFSLITLISNIPYNLLIVASVTDSEGQEYLSA